MSGPDGQEWYERWGDRDRSPAEHTLTGAYRLLTVLMLVSIAAALLLPENRLVQQFAPNAATEVFGIIITLAFVQQLLYRQERARRMRSSIGAYRRSGWALTRLVSVWADTVKGCHRGDEVPGNLERLFAPHLTEVLVNLDPVVSTGGEEPVAWVHRLGTEIEAVTAQLNRVVADEHEPEPRPPRGLFPAPRGDGAAAQLAGSGGGDSAQPGPVAAHRHTGHGAVARP